MPEQNLGRVSVIHKGEWSSTEIYRRLDIVSFNGSSYLSKHDLNDVYVGDTTSWELVASKGDQGPTGPTGRQGDTGDSGICGLVGYFPTDSTPTGWFRCNGAFVSRTDYSELFNVIGTSYGVGNGQTTFTLPDLRGEFIRCWDNGRGIDVLPTRRIGTFQGDAIRNIEGEFQVAFSYFNDSDGAFSRLGSGSVDVSQDLDATGSRRMYFDASTVVPTASENRPRNVALLACIKY